MFANCQKGGKHFGFPDVCKTPAPPAPSPVPVPYPDMAELPTTGSPCTKILFDGSPAHNIKAAPQLSNGDNAGVAGGMKSSKFMGAVKVKQGSNALKLKGKPAAKLLSPTEHNNGNVPGITIAPSQTKIMVMK
jgi:hypothetical protein